MTARPNVGHAEEVPLGVGEHHEGRSVWVGPIGSACTEADQAVYLGDQLLLAFDIQVQVHAVVAVQRDSGAAGFGRDQHRRFVIINTPASDPVTESHAPKLRRSFHIRDVDIDRPDRQHGPQSARGFAWTRLSIGWLQADLFDFCAN